LMITIRSKKFILRPFKKGDELSVAKNINNIKIARNTLHIVYPYDMKAARSWIELNLKLDKEKDKSQFHLAIAINGEASGGIGLSQVNGHSAEIGYWLGENYWGRGIATKAVKLLTRHAFAKLGLRRVYAYVFPFNKASSRVLQKAGYKFEGKLRKNILKDGKPIDELLFAKTR